MAYHWARMIELLHSVEKIQRAAARPRPAGHGPGGQGRAPRGGVGLIEAPRGTLFHHYQVDENDQVAMANLIVSTTNNNEPMNRAVTKVRQGSPVRQGDHRRPAQPRRGGDPRLRSVPVLRHARARADAADGRAARRTRARCWTARARDDARRPARAADRLRQPGPRWTTASARRWRRASRRLPLPGRDGGGGLPALTWRTPRRLRRHDVVIFADAATTGAEPFSFGRVEPARRLELLHAQPAAAGRAGPGAPAVRREDRGLHSRDSRV